ncbi:MAG: gamma-glutamyltransferase, partial [Rhodospirillaceae bacterium]|nr:gamma-glutamyltransferase [Rhodospirillaceae bacterium]
MIYTKHGRSGMISAPHHLAAEAGANILRAGGNAVEAMVAAAATIAVVYPHMNSIGGDGFWIISEPGQEPIGIDACGPAAALAHAGGHIGTGAWRGGMENSGDSFDGTETGGEMGGGGAVQVNGRVAG